MQLATSLGLGLLVGFQREWAAPHVAGIRTFALMTLLGTLCALLVESLGSWIVVAGFFVVAGSLFVGYWLQFVDVDADPGLTTTAAALLMYAVGAAVVLLPIELPIIVGGVAAVLLHWKEPLHGFVERMGEADIRAIIQLVLIALVILPILPDRVYGPYDVFNPYQIWLMVVLICGISLGGFITFKFLGTRAGTILGGILGGVISSTATTVSYSRRTRTAPKLANMAAVVIMLASTIVFGRVILEIGLVAPGILKSVVPPLVVMMLWMGLISGGLYLWSDRSENVSLPDDDPSELKAAMVFGVLYALVLFAVAWATENFGNSGLYVVAALSGLTDMDAITLSTAQMIEADRVAVDIGWRMILIGTLSNLVFKAIAIGLLGNRKLLYRILVVFGLSWIGGLLLLSFWPSS